MLAFHVAAGIVMAVAFLGVCYLAFIHRAQIARAAMGVLLPVAAPLWRHKISVVCVTVACGTLVVLAMIRSDARRGVLNTYYSSKYYSSSSNEDWKRPSKFLETWNK